MVGLRRFRWLGNSLLGAGVVLALVGCNTRNNIFDSNAASVTPSLTPSPRGVFVIDMNPPALTGGGIARGTVTLTPPDTADDSVVMLSSTDPTVNVPASVRLLAGAQSVDFPVTTASVSSDRQVSIEGVTSGRSAHVTLFLWAVFPLSFSWVSEVGDHVGSGGFGRLTGETATMSAEGNTSVVAIRVNAPRDNWVLYFAAPRGMSLRAGPYENATRYLNFPDATRPAMDVGGRGRGCGSLSGRFHVQEVDVRSNSVVRFNATFEQHCNDASAPLTGEIRFVAQPR